MSSIVLPVEMFANVYRSLSNNLEQGARTLTSQGLPNRQHSIFNNKMPQSVGSQTSNFICSKRSDMVLEGGRDKNSLYYEHGLIQASHKSAQC